VTDTDILLKELGINNDAFGHTFGLMEIADDEIVRAQKRWPDRADQIDEGFSILCPSPCLMNVNEKIYRAHCAELLDRVARNQDTGTATDAEILWSLSQLSQSAPLNHDASAAFRQLFEKVMGFDATPEIEPFRETWDGAVEELIGTFRSKLTIIDRKVK
jgi:hypothetical protein